MRQKHYIYIGIGLILLCVAYFFINNYLNTNQVKKFINDQLPENITLEYDDLDTNVLLGNLSISDATVVVKDKGIRIELGKFSLKGLDYTALLTTDTIAINSSSLQDAYVWVDKSKIDTTQREKKKERKNVILKLNNLDLDFSGAEMRDESGHLTAQMNATHIALDDLLVQTLPETLENQLKYNLISIKTDSLHLPLSKVQQLQIGNMMLKDSIFQLYDTQLTLRDKGIDVNFDLLELKGSELGRNFVNDTIDFQSCTLTKGKIRIDNSKKQTKNTKDSLNAANKVIRVDKINIQESEFEFLDKKGKAFLKFEKTNAAFADMKILTAPKDSQNSLTYKFIDLNAEKLELALSSLHTLTSTEVRIDDKQAVFDKLKVDPNYGKLEFQNHIATEKDVLTLTTNNLTLYDYDYSFDKENNLIAAKEIVFNSPHLNIYRNKATPDDKTRKPLYSEMLRELDLRVAVDKINVYDGYLAYEEHLPGKKVPGKIYFEDMEFTVNHIYNKDRQKEHTKLDIDAKFMGHAPTHIEWDFHILNPADKFNISGTIHNLNASSLDDFLTPNLKAKIDGRVNRTDFNFTGNDYGLQGVMNMKYNDLNVDVLNNKEEKKGFWSVIANFLVKDNNKNTEQDKRIQVERNQQKSFFNMFWLGLKEGLKVNVLKFQGNKSKSTNN